MKLKMKKELRDFKEFKTNYDFSLKEIKMIDNKYFCDDILIKDENGNLYGESEKWINVGYKLHGSFSQTLSNLFPYKIKFRGKTFTSLECFFQGIKFKDKRTQNFVFQYFGTQAVHIKIAADNDFKTTHKLYWQGKPIDRFGQEYQDMLDELYISAIQNPLYRNILTICDRPIIHSMGELEKEKTTLTRFEFEETLNCLSAFLKSRKK